jgi:hypothetical protein
MKRDRPRARRYKCPICGIFPVTIYEDERCYDKPPCPRCASRPKVEYDVGFYGERRKDG